MLCSGNVRFCTVQDSTTALAAHIHGGSGRGRAGVLGVLISLFWLERATAPRTERRIVDLRAQGRDVHEIAQQLFLTPSTVSGVLEVAAGTAR